MLFGSCSKTTGRKGCFYQSLRLDVDQGAFNGGKSLEPEVEVPRLRTYVLERTSHRALHC